MGPIYQNKSSYEMVLARPDGRGVVIVPPVVGFVEGAHFGQWTRLTEVPALPPGARLLYSQTEQEEAAAPVKTAQAALAAARAQSSGRPAPDPADTDEQDAAKLEAAALAAEEAAQKAEAAAAGARGKSKK